MATIYEHLRCPLTSRRLSVASAGRIESLNARINSGELKHVGGSPVTEALAAALVTEDNALAYRIDDGIAVLLAPFAIRLDEAAPATPSHKLAARKDQVRRFYEELGWSKSDESTFVDAERFEDLRPVAAEYIHNCHLRLMEHFRNDGRFLLDVASGPIQYPEYLRYSENFDKRVCVDISLVALKEAKKKLGDRGEYILADITALPFEDGIFDAVLSLHTVYHVPADEQPRAFEELYRVLGPGRAAVVVYSWGNAALLQRLLRAMFLPMRAAGWLAKKLRPPATKNDQPQLYFHPHSYEWFTGENWGFRYEIYPWRSVNILATQKLIRPMLGGKTLLRWLFSLENRLPKLMGKIGQHPTIRILKGASENCSRSQQK